MNGFEVCEKLKSSDGTRNICIVAVSGDYDPAVRSRILQAGADVFFTKPLDIVEFRNSCLKLVRE
jgi:two-component system cell cycle response regulator